MYKDVIIFLTGIDTYSGYGFVHNTSACTVIYRFTEFLVYHDDILLNSVSV